MKLLIAADIHGNFDAWSALPEEFDELWVLGDLVNYGPQPREVIENVMAKASLVVQGNHDHAVAHDDDSRWTSRYRKLSEATRRFTSSVLTDEHKAYLRSLPLQARTERGGARFHLTHATPRDPLYGRHQPGSDAWVEEFSEIDADVLLVAHSHVPFVRWFGEKVVLNPGSIGQPRTGDPLARYAIWRDGEFELKTYRYPIASTAAKLMALPLPYPVQAELVSILKTGKVG